MLGWHLSMRFRRQPRPMIEINAANDLDQLLSASRHVTIKLPFLASFPAERAYWETQINHRRQACGCQEGTFLLLLAIVALVGVRTYSSASEWGSVLWWTVITPVTCIVSIGAGKAYGRYRAHLTLLRTIRELRRRTHHLLSPLDLAPETTPSISRSGL